MFQEHSRFTGQQGKLEGKSLPPLNCFYPLHRHLHVIQEITTETSSICIAGSPTWTKNFDFRVQVPNYFSRLIYANINYIYKSIYRISHWTILWSSYRKLAWAGFEPKCYEFRSDSLTDWAITPKVQLTLRTNFVQPLQFH